MIKKIINRLKKIIRAFRFFLRGIYGFFSGKFNIESNNILLVYDARSQPYSIGDLLLLQVASNILCLIYKCDCVDITFNYNKKNPSQCDKVFKGVVTGDNVLYNITRLIPILNFNKNLNQISIFSRPDFLNNKINRENYKVIYPSPYSIASATYITPHIFDEVIYPFFIKNGFIPKLAPRDHLLSWAKKFLIDNFGQDSVVVTVNIRNNLDWSSERNSNLQAWSNLFKKNLIIKNLYFLVICDRHEILRELSHENVVFAKDHCTSLDEDMALIYAADFHMGSNSGPTNVAIFNDKPYRIFNTDFDKSNIYNKNILIKIDDDYHRFVFSSNNQKVYGSSENFDVLYQNFLELYESIDNSKSFNT